MTDQQLRLEVLKIAAFSIDKFVHGKPVFEDIDRLADHMIGYIRQGDPLDRNVDKLDLPVSALQLPRRAYNALVAWDIHTIRQLVGKTYVDLMKLSGMGTKAAGQVEQALKQWGLGLKPLDKP